MSNVCIKPMALSSSSPGLGKLSHLPIYPSFPTVAHKCLKPVHVASVKGGDSGDGIALPPLNAPVYSLATHDADGRQHTLNIVTYTSPVSIRPKYYALGLYRGTLSWENMLETGEAALQILGVHHTPLFELLGRSSGRSIDKIAQLKQQGQELEEYRGWVILKDCIGVIHLKVASETMQLGDHDLVICSVLDSQPREARKQPLYTDDLRNLGLI